MPRDRTASRVEPLGPLLDQVHQVDCIEALRGLDANSVDFCFCDPPYNIDVTYESGIDDKRAVQDYLVWMSDWIYECGRVLKKDGNLWIAQYDEFVAQTRGIAEGWVCPRPFDDWPRLKLRNWVIWYYTFGVNNQAGLTRSHTHLLHLVKSGKAKWFPDQVRIPSARQLQYNDKRANPDGRLPDNTWIIRPNNLPGLFPEEEDTWMFSRVCGTTKQRRKISANQMPEQLLGRILRLCTEPGDVVLDPFAGSGTTLAVAKKLGRRFVGFELGSDTALQAQFRVESCEPGDPLDGPVPG